MFKRYILFRSSQVLLDFLLIYVAFLFTYFWRVGWVFSTDLMFQTFAVFAFFACGVWISFLLFTKYYRIPPRSGVRVWFDVALVVLGGLLANGFLVVTYFFSRAEVFSRMISVVGFVVGVLLLLLSQVFFRMLLRRFKQKSQQVYRTLIIGANRVAEHLVSAINSNPYVLNKVIGVIDPYGLYKDFQGAEILGKLNKLEDVCRAHEVNAIIQCDGFEHTLSLIGFCEEQKIKFEVDPALRGVFEKNLRIRETSGVNLISYVKRDFDSQSKRGIYRVIDFLLRQVFDVD